MFLSFYNLLTLVKNYKLFIYIFIKKILFIKLVVIYAYTYIYILIKSSINISFKYKTIRLNISLFNL